MNNEQLFMVFYQKQTVILSHKIFANPKNTINFAFE